MTYMTACGGRGTRQWQTSGGHRPLSAPVHALDVAAPAEPPRRRSTPRRRRPRSSSGSGSDSRGTALSDDARAVAAVHDALRRQAEAGILHQPVAPNVVGEAARAQLLNAGTSGQWPPQRPAQQQAAVPRSEARRATAVSARQENCGGGGGGGSLLAKQGTQRARGWPATQTHVRRMPGACRAVPLTPRTPKRRTIEALWVSTALAVGGGWRARRIKHSIACTSPPLLSWHLPATRRRLGTTAAAETR
jgi:hypothetical protein